MSEAFTVRPAGPADASAVARLVSEAGLPTAGLDRVWVTLLAEDADGLAGVAALERHGPDEAPVFLLRSVAVQPDRRGRGLAAALVAAALDSADTTIGAPATVALLTETALRTPNETVSNRGAYAKSRSV